jgi:hypothetical protein
MIVGNSRVAVCFFCLMAVQVSSAMDQSCEKQLSLSGASQEGSLPIADYHLLPKNSFWAFCDTVTQPAVTFYTSNIAPVTTSFCNTVKIKFDNDEACLKLGYPVGNEQADKELLTTFENYKKYDELTVEFPNLSVNSYKDRDQYPKVHAEFIELEAFVERRRQFVRRIIDEILPVRFDNLPLAEHCLKYHELVMCALLKKRFSLFVAFQKKLQGQSTAQHNQTLLTLLSEKKPQEDQPKGEDAA